MALWTSISPGKPTRMASEIPKVSDSQEARVGKEEGAKEHPTS